MWITRCCFERNETEYKESCKEKKIVTVFHFYIIYKEKKNVTTRFLHIPSTSIIFSKGNDNNVIFTTGKY